MLDLEALVGIFDESLVGANSTRFEIRNGTARPRIVWVELWADDYTLFPGEFLEFVHWGRVDAPPSVTEYNDQTVIVLSPCTDEMTFGNYLVHQEGILLQSGHQRQAGMDAGLVY